MLSILDLVRRRRLLVALATVAAAAGLALVATPAAHAGSYIHLPCRGATGSSAGGAAGGWAFSAGPGYGYGTDTCTGKGGDYLKVDMMNGQPVPAWADVAYHYTAPADTRIGEFAGAWGGWARSWDGASGGIIHINGDGFDLGQVINFADGSRRPFAVGGLNGTWIRASVGCWAGTSCPPDGWGFGWLAIWDPYVKLYDNDAPAAGGTFGTAVSDAKWVGAERFNYSATDKGGGIQTLRYYVDGALKQSWTPNDNGGRCAPFASDANGSAYSSAVPCPLSVNSAVDVATGTVADGNHTVRFDVVDVAGNATTLYSATKLFANSPPANAKAPTFADGAVAAAPKAAVALVADPGTWSGPKLTFAHAWQRCDSDGTGCATIPGATALTYAPVLADVGHKLRLAVTATNDADSMTVYSPLTGVVANNPPVNVRAPAYKDAARAAAPRLGSTIGVIDDGVWSGPNLVVSRSWQRCDANGCFDIDEATGLNYTPSTDDLGKALRLRVTAENFAGPVTVATPMSGVVTAEGSGGALIPKPNVGGQVGSSVLLQPGLPGVLGASAASHTFVGHVVGEAAGAACPEDRARLSLPGVKASKVSLRYGEPGSARVLLTCATNGKPIAGAALQVATKLGLGPVVASEVTTDGKGVATLRFERGPSRAVTVGYRMYADDQVVRATATLKVLIPAKIALRGNHRRLRNGKVLTLSGRLYGGHIPRRGVNLTMQWKDRYKWRPFAQIKTTRKGTFRYAYRFTRTTRRVTYHLRVQLVKGQVDYPFEVAASKPVRVTVGP